MFSSYFLSPIRVALNGWRSGLRQLSICRCGRDVGSARVMWVQASRSCLDWCRWPGSPGAVGLPLPFASASVMPQLSTTRQQQTPHDGTPILPFLPIHGPILHASPYPTLIGSFGIGPVVRRDPCAVCQRLRQYVHRYPLNTGSCEYAWLRTSCRRTGLLAGVTMLVWARAPSGDFQLPLFHLALPFRDHREITVMLPAVSGLVRSWISTRRHPRLCSKWMYT